MISLALWLGELSAKEQGIIQIIADALIESEKSNSPVLVIIPKLRT